MKKVELIQELKKLEIPIVEPQKVVEKVVKKVDIQEPELSESEDEESDHEVVAQEVAQGVVKEVAQGVAQEVVKEKKVKKIARRKVKEVVNKDGTKELNNLIKIFVTDVRNLLHIYDDGDIDRYDEEDIRNEFDKLDGECRDKMDVILESCNISDSKIKGIEDKLDTQYKKIQRFLEIN